MVNDALSLLMAAIGGGGVAAAAATIVTARSTAKKTRAEAAKLNATTDAEVDALAMATMRSALESANERIVAMSEEREADRKYYQDRIVELEGRVETLRAEVRAAEERLAAVLASTEATAEEIRHLKQHPHD